MSGLKPMKLSEETVRKVGAETGSVAFFVIGIVPMEGSEGTKVSILSHASMLANGQEIPREAVEQFANLRDEIHRDAAQRIAALLGGKAVELPINPAGMN